MLVANGHGRRSDPTVGPTLAVDPALPHIDRAAAVGRHGRPARVFPCPSPGRPWRRAAAASTRDPGPRRLPLTAGPRRARLPSLNEIFISLGEPCTPRPRCRVPVAEAACATAM